MKSKYPYIGELMVLQSAAGYYIGRLYYYSVDEYQPYSRESTYMSEEVANRCLSVGDWVDHFPSY